MTFRTGNGLRVTMALGLAICLGAASAFGQLTAESESSKRVQDRSYRMEETGADIPYSVYVPTTYDGSKEFPLIVLLHGLGSSANQIIRYRGFTDLAEQNGYIVFAPMGYNNHGWYGSLGTGVSKIGANLFKGEGEDPENLGELSEKDVMNVLEMARKEFKIDSNRIFLMGHSMGGGGTLYIGTKYHEIWAGLAPIAPAMYSSTDVLEKAKHIPIIVVHGDQDRLVDVNVSRRWTEKMKELGMDYKYIEVAGGDHVMVAPDNLPAIFEFFKGKSKAATK